MMIPGIIKIRSQVSVFGTFQCDALGPLPPLLPWVEMLINYLGELPPQTSNLHEIVDAGTQYSLQAAELLQQLASFDGSQARYGLEYGLIVTLRPLAPVSRDREPVRLVRHPLNQMQGTGIRRQYSGRLLTQQEQLFLSRPPIGALRHAD